MPEAKVGEIDIPLLNESPVRVETDELATVIATFIVAVEVTESVAVIVAV